jgi:hypothetical protein
MAFLDRDPVQHCGRATLMGVFVSFTPADPSPDGAGQSGHPSVNGYLDVIAVHEGTPEEPILDVLFDLFVAQIGLRSRHLGNVVRRLVVIRPAVITIVIVITIVVVGIVIAVIIIVVGGDR